jgi:hypothetical protein
VRYFVECGFRGHLSNRVDSDLSAFGVSLTVSVEHLEGDLFDAQDLQSACSVPCWNRWHPIFGTVCLGQHEPITTEHEPLECDFRLGIVTVWPLLFDGSFTPYGHGKLDSLSRRAGDFELGGKNLSSAA